jgi:hypothetical protein
MLFSFSVIIPAIIWPLESSQPHSCQPVRLAQAKPDKPLFQRATHRRKTFISIAWQ